MLVEKNPANNTAWFTFEQVEKPKIASPHWEDETMFAENKERAVATYMPYNNVKEMLADAEYYATPWTEPVNAREFAKGLIKHEYREGYALPAMPEDV